MITLADCFPQWQPPAKLKLGMVISYKDGYDPCLIIGIRDAKESTEKIVLTLLNGKSQWSNQFSTRNFVYSEKEVSYKEIAPALGCQEKELSEWKIWTKKEVSEWFLKNYPATH